MHSKPVYQAAKALARTGVATLRFNFRGVGRSRGTHDGGPGEMSDFRAALDFLETRYPGLAVWAAGFSFGSWIAWNVGLDDPRVPLLLGIGLPVNLLRLLAGQGQRQGEVPDSRRARRAHLDP